MLDLSSLQQAVHALKRTIGVIQDAEAMAILSEDQKNAINAGVIQHFEFTYELSWKFIKRFLESELGSSVVDGIPRRELFRIAAEHHLIRHTESWFDFHMA